MKVYGLPSHGVLRFRLMVDELAFFNRLGVVFMFVMMKHFLCAVSLMSLSNAMLAQILFHSSPSWII